jgi:hypothetical protein
MKPTIAAAVTLAACMGNQLLAQNVKEGTITFALTSQSQSSVSETTAANAGDWVDPTTGRGPTHYKSSTSKITEQDLIKDMSYTIHGTPGYFGSSPKLVLVQGELSGFFSESPALAASVPYFNDGYSDSDDDDASTAIANSSDSLSTLLAQGRNFQTNPITGQNPIGHLQPWGQIYIKPGKGADVTNCENVTYFFGLTVQECYDCFYLNSFVSDSTFTFKTVNQTQSGPPCCSLPAGEELFGSGKDSYYLTLSFDDTQNNPYLWPSDVEDSAKITSDNPYYVGVTGVTPAADSAAGIVSYGTNINDYLTVPARDGIIPDILPYVNTIKSGIETPSPYEARFTLNGILTYTWNLKFLNSSDLAPDFVGSAKYSATGYGFIQLFCSLLTGTVSINETVSKISLCCPEENGDFSGLDDSALDYWWYAVGTFNDTWDTDSTESLNSNVYFLWDGFTPSTPLNTGANLSYHANYNEAYTAWETFTAH